jgi:hypothetical protein
MWILSLLKVSSRDFYYHAVKKLCRFHLGMGRAIHTNLNASFKMESLKIAVIKVKIE